MHTNNTRTHLNNILHQLAITRNISPVQLHFHCRIFTQHWQPTSDLSNEPEFFWYSIDHSNKYAHYMFALLMWCYEAIDACWQYSAHFTGTESFRCKPWRWNCTGCRHWSLERGCRSTSQTRTHSDGEDDMVQLTLHSSHGEHILDFLRLDSNLY